MIIHCKNCGTKYRFEKTKVAGDGVWVRCTRCGNVFFQENPLAEISSLMDMVAHGRKTSEETVSNVDPIEKIITEPALDYTLDDQPDLENDVAKLGETAPDKTLGDIKIADDESGSMWNDNSYEEIEIEEDMASEKILGDIDAGIEEPMPRMEEHAIDSDDKMELESSRNEESEDIEDPFDKPETDYTARGPQWEKSDLNTVEKKEAGPVPARQRVRDPWLFDDAEENRQSSKKASSNKIGTVWRVLKKVFLCLLLVSLLSGLAYIFLSPKPRQAIIDSASPLMEKFLGAEDSRKTEKSRQAGLPKTDNLSAVKAKDIPKDLLPELKVKLVDLGERFVKGWTDENIMVIEGFAVNDSTIAVSNINVKGKILDSSGKVLSEEKSGCGTILTDDELKSMTDEEIKKELSNIYGRNFRNTDIAPGDRIPFMLVILMPSGEASEIVVELAGIEAAKAQ